VMVTFKLKSGEAFDAAAFTHFVDGAAHLPPRWRPRFVRIAGELAVTHTNKVLKRQLRREKFLVTRGGDPVYWRRTKEAVFELFTVADLEELRARFAAAGNLHRWEE